MKFPSIIRQAYAIDPPIPTNNNTDGDICNPVLEAVIGGCGANVDGGTSLAILMARLFRMSVIVGAIALLLYLIWGGINWITAGGDKAKVEAAQGRITNAIIGMLVLFGTVAIAIAINYVVGFENGILNPSLSTGGTP